MYHFPFFSLMPVIALYEFIIKYLACVLLMEIILCRSFAAAINATINGLANLHVNVHKYVRRTDIQKGDCSVKV